MKIKESNRRLLVLADFLEKLPPKRFNYTLWVGLDWKGLPDLSCGTTACALGWATVIPEFRDLGLTLVRQHTRRFGHAYVTAPGVTADGADGSFKAAQLVFGVDCAAAGLLFSPYECNGDDCAGEHDEEDGCSLENEELYSTPSYVANKIKDFVNGR